MRRIQQSVVCLLLLGASAGASFALAPQMRSLPQRAESRLEAPASPGLLAALRDLVARAWGRIGCKIDPFGRCLTNRAPAATPPAGDSGNTHGDTGCEIDPLGSCAALH
jgi:hypothetical protein